MDKVLNYHEALIYTMITMSAVEGNISDRELKRIGMIVQTLPVFKDFDVNELTTIAQECGQIAGGRDGLHDVLNLISGSLPKQLHETAYALAVEVAAADLKVAKEEIRFLALLRDQLGLDKMVTSAIERGAQARLATV